MSRQPIAKALEAELAAAEKAITRAKARRARRLAAEKAASKRTEEADTDVATAEQWRDRVAASIKALAAGDGHVPDQGPDGDAPAPVG